MNTIERLRELLATGTPLPWQNEQDVYRHGEPHAIAVWNPVDGHCRVMVANGNFPDVAKADAAKALAAVNALPALLAVVEAQAAEIAARRLPWRCPYCGRRYAEYVNGCPACHFGEPGTATSVKMDTDGIESLRLKTDAALRALGEVKP